MQVQAEKRYYTPAEYLALEEAADYKNEYRDGEIVPMTGGSVNHNRIVLNLSSHLNFALRGTDYEPFSSDVRLWIPRHRIFTYPDIMIIQGKPAYYENRKDTITNPLVIIEVLSKSTQEYDQTNKFKYYRTLPGFREYILIDQYETYIEHFIKTEQNQWVLIGEHETSDAVLQLAAVEVSITLSDIYQRVTFE